MLCSSRSPRAWIPDEVWEALGYETPSSRLRKLEAAVAKLTGAKADLAERARLKLERGQPVSRDEAASFLGLTRRTVQRMEAAGRLQRCPGLGTVVRYAARDVLRLASANGKER